MSSVWIHKRTRHWTQDCPVVKERLEQGEFQNVINLEDTRNPEHLERFDHDCTLSPCVKARVRAGVDRI